MGNCGTKPKTSDGDDAPPPAEPPRAPAAEGELRKDEEEVPATEEANQAVVAPRSEVRRMISTSELVFPRG